ncbi:hypothetical protein NC99_11400 [Sunxiuqinia dokdonensis]|uniref:Uncharacterized protein n=1 Tax=Sunxiuqinia dokdonensis TaxID=1409788 RepID=A0A0L8VC67_9BACT|nr:hypothetical protein NC99_11400 [Sunxiuqinia dokdonensis]
MVDPSAGGSPNRNNFNRMKNLKKRIENMNIYLNAGSYSAQDKKTIRGKDLSMSSAKITKTLHDTKSTRTSDKIKTSI